MHRSLWVVAAATVVAASLGCAGLVGYGTVQATTPVVSGVPWSVSYLASSNDPYQLWLSYDVSTRGGSYQVSGDVVISGHPSIAASYPMTFNDTDAPIGSSRMTYGSLTTTVNGVSSNSGSIWLVEIPAVPAGTTVTASGVWAVAPNTHVTTLNIVVTD